MLRSNDGVQSGKACQAMSVPTVVPDPNSKTLCAAIVPLAIGSGLHLVISGRQDSGGELLQRVERRWPSQDSGALLLAFGGLGASPNAAAQFEKLAVKRFGPLAVSHIAHIAILT
jgi:hypothetical protein